MDNLIAKPQPISVPTDDLELTIVRSGKRWTVYAWDRTRRQGYTMSYPSRRSAASAAYARIVKGWAR